LLSKHCREMHTDLSCETLSLSLSHQLHLFICHRLQWDLCKLNADTAAEVSCHSHTFKQSLHLFFRTRTPEQFKGRILAHKCHLKGNYIGVSLCFLPFSAFSAFLKPCPLFIVFSRTTSSLLQRSASHTSYGIFISTAFLNFSARHFRPVLGLSATSWSRLAFNSEVQFGHQFPY
jgi:hypothetical protein